MDRMKHVSVVEQNGKTLFTYCDDFRTTYELVVDYSRRELVSTKNDKHTLDLHTPHRNMIVFYGLDEFRNVTVKDWAEKKKPAQAEQKNPEPAEWTLMDLNRELVKDLRSCNTALEIDCCTSICVQEMRELWKSICTRRTPTAIERSVAEQHGFINA